MGPKAKAKKGKTSLPSAGGLAATGTATKKESDTFSSRSSLLDDEVEPPVVQEAHGKEKSPSLEFHLSLLAAKKPLSSLEQPKKLPIFVLELAKRIIPRYCGLTEGEILNGWSSIDYCNGIFFEGTMVDGFVHGKGRIEWNDDVQYLGDFNMNEITGEGSYQWADKSTYKGQVQNGLRHGKGIFQTHDGSKTYSGDWKEGQKYGKGRIMYNGQELNDYYEGELQFDVPHGHGVRQYKSGNVYKGQWKNGVKDGQGVMIWKDKKGMLQQMYRGVWANNCPNGHGELMWYVTHAPPSGHQFRNQYCGYWLNGCRHGFGVMTYASGARYEGEWCGNMRQGNGTFTAPNGRVVHTLFQNDHLISPGDSDENSAVTIPFHLPSYMYDWRSFIRKCLPLLATPPAKEQMSVEAEWVKKVILQFLPALRIMYTRYGKIGRGTQEEAPDGVNPLTRLGCWLLARDAQLGLKGLAIAKLERQFAEMSKINGISHDPSDEIPFWRFLQFLITAGVMLYGNDTEKQRECCNIPIVAASLQLVLKDILPKCTGKEEKEAPYDEDCRPWSLEGLPPLPLMYRLFISINGDPIGTPMAARDFLRRLLSIPQQLSWTTKPPTTSVATAVATDSDKPAGMMDKCTDKPPEIKVDGLFGHLQTTHIVQEIRKLYPTIVGVNSATDTFLDIELSFLDFCEVMWACTRRDLARAETEQRRREHFLERQVSKKEDVISLVSSAESITSIQRKLSMKKVTRPDKKGGKTGSKAQNKMKIQDSKAFKSPRPK